MSFEPTHIPSLTQNARQRAMSQVEVMGTGNHDQTITAAMTMKMETTRGQA